jgi:hypothetical protein
VEYALACSKTNNPEPSWPVVFVVGALSFGQHALMQDAGNQNAAGRLTVKDNVSAVLHSPKSGTNIIAHPTQRGVNGKHLAARFQIVDVTSGLALPPKREGYNRRC